MALYSTHFTLTHTYTHGTVGSMVEKSGTIFLQNLTRGKARHGDQEPRRHRQLMMVTNGLFPENTFLKLSLWPKSFKLLFETKC